jgi:predicted Zn-dependent peptidase
MKAGLLMGLESASNRAERLARMVQIWGKVPNLEETVARVDAVDLDKLRTYAQSVASSAKMATALYGPIAAAPDLSALEARRAA